MAMATAYEFGTNLADNNQVVNTRVNALGECFNGPIHPPLTQSDPLIEVTNVNHHGTCKLEENSVRVISENSLDHHRSHFAHHHPSPPRHPIHHHNHHEHHHHHLTHHHLTHQNQNQNQHQISHHPIPQTSQQPTSHSLAYTTHHHLTSSYSPVHDTHRPELTFTPSNFTGSSEFCPSSDRAPSPAITHHWSQQSHRVHHLNSNDDHLRHRSISLSTPTNSSSHSSLNPISDQVGLPNSIGRILSLPHYGIGGSPDLRQIEPHQLPINGLPELDHRYLGSTPSNRKFSARVLANAYEPYPPSSCDYSSNPAVCSAGCIPPPTTYEFTSRLPSSPNYRHLPSRQFASPVNGNIGLETNLAIGNKRKAIHSSSIDSIEGSTPPLKRQNIGNSSPKIIHVPHAKEVGHQRMTTVLCLHASVAQKSYGQEKRFLCPPPLVRITGPYRQLPKQNRPVLSMTILNEEGERHLSQSAYLGEEDTNVHFKSLHISGAAKKAKHVSLELALHPPVPWTANQALQTMGPELEELSMPFATFNSEDCAIISKPSKKTAKARNTQSCIFNGSTICLFNRINSQTVRTKYLCVENDQLAARASQWSAFTINVVRRAEDAGIDGSPPIATKTLLSSSIPGADRTVTYGSEVELIDFVTGVSSGPLVVRKVEKTKVQKDATGPISQMQKLAFCKIDRTDGSALYVSALEPGRYPSPNELGSPFEMGGDANGIPFTTPRPPHLNFHALQYQAPRAVLPPEERGGMTLDEIDDSVAWTVIGVSHFSHTFFDLSPNYPQIPLEPVTPLPMVNGLPKIEIDRLTLTMSLDGFFDGHARPMEIWLGPLGPLPVNVLNTSGIKLAAEEGTIGSVRLQVTGQKRQESQVLINLPTIETIYWTLHNKEMKSNSMIILDESNRPISELIGRRQISSLNNAIPTLPITLIRADGMSFVMTHSICVAESEDERGKNGEPVCILKVI